MYQEIYRYYKEDSINYSTTPCKWNCKGWWCKSTQTRMLATQLVAVQCTRMIYKSASYTLSYENSDDASCITILILLQSVLTHMKLTSKWTCLAYESINIGYGARAGDSISRYPQWAVLVLPCQELIMWKGRGGQREYQICHSMLCQFIVLGWLNTSPSVRDSSQLARCCLLTLHRFWLLSTTK